MTEALQLERPAHVRPEQFVDFDIYAPPGIEQDFHAGWQKLHEPGVPDVVWTPRNGGHWIVTRNHLLDEVFADHTRFSSRVILLPKASGEQHNLIPTTLDPPVHRPYRNVLNSSLAPRAVSAIEEGIRDIAIDLIEKVRLQGHCNFTTAYSEVLPIRVFMTMFGLPLEDSAKLKAWADATTRGDGSISMGDALERIGVYLKPFLDERKGKDGTDMLSRIVNGRIGDRQMTDTEALQMAVQLLIAGLDTVVNFLGFTFVFLAQNPEHRRMLVDNPALIPDALEELLRRYPLVTIGREVVEDMEYHGAQLKKGDMVATATPLGGLDPSVNPDPMRIDFKRAGAQHVTFGTGPHKCPGAHLARTELRITLEEWLKRIPEFRLADDTPLRYAGGIAASIVAVPLVWDPASTRAA
ncbi:cytochrome P450 [Parapedomonas caeni]